MSKPDGIRTSPFAKIRRGIYSAVRQRSLMVGSAFLKFSRERDDHTLRNGVIECLRILGEYGTSI